MFHIYHIPILGNLKMERLLAHNNGNYQNKIAQQFSSVCSDARTRRLDLKTGIQLARNFRRLTNYKQERQFITVRNAVGLLL